MSGVGANNKQRPLLMSVAESELQRRCGVLNTSCQGAAGRLLNVVNLLHCLHVRLGVPEAEGLRGRAGLQLRDRHVHAHLCCHPGCYRRGAIHRQSATRWIWKKR